METSASFEARSAPSPHPTNPHVQFERRTVVSIGEARCATSDPTPVKSPNKAKVTVAEEREGRGLAKGNSNQQNAFRTQGRGDAPSALERVREVASGNKAVKFTALMHHVYDPEALRAAFWKLKKDAAPGVDGKTWQHYVENLENNLQDLSHRLKQGGYQAKPVRRVYIPKADGAATARSHGAGGQNCPESGGGGVKRHLRGRLCRFFVWIPARAQPA